MNLEEEFDDIFKRKTEEAKFSFRESDWEKARKMIDHERLAAFNSASRVNYWYVSALVLISSVAVIYYALPETPQLAQADEVLYSPEINNTAEFASGTTETTSEIGTDDLTPKASGPVHYPLSASKTTNGGLAMKQGPRSIGHSGGGSQTTKDIRHTESFAGNTSNPEEQDATFSEENPESNKVLVKSNTGSVYHSLNRKENTMVLFDQVKELQLYPVFLKRYEEEDYAPKQKFNRHVLDVVLGLNYFAGWDNNGTVTAKGLNGFAGLSYGYFLTKKLNLSLGAEVYNISNMNQEFYNNTSKNYGFGSTQTQTMLTCQSMLFLSFPLRVYYVADEHHSIGLGLHAGTLLMASNTVETSELSDGVKQNVNTVSSKGVYQGMNTNNILISASLNKTIGDRIGLQLELYYGLSDLFTNTPSNGYQQNANGVRVGMNYRIFRN